LRQDFQALAEVAERIVDWDMFVKVQGSWGTVGATQAPKDFLKAIDQWNETASLFVDTDNAS
jgi:hypothetical protein